MLTSPRNPRVREVVRLRERRHRDRLRRFVVEGWRELRRAADGGLSVRALFHCPDLPAGGDADLIDRFAAAGATCESTSRAVFERMSYRRTPDGLLAVADTPSLALDDRQRAGGGDLWLVAAAIGVPGNLGAMLRSADAAGATGVLVADPAIDVFNPNVVRASVGAVFCVPVAVADGDAARAWLAARNIRVVVADPAADTLYTDADLADQVAIVVGSENAGVDAAWRRAASQTVRLPMAGRVDSLNAAAAATVLLFEAQRQRERDIRVRPPAPARAASAHGAFKPTPLQ